MRLEINVFVQMALLYVLKDNRNCCLKLQARLFVTVNGGDIDSPKWLRKIRFSHKFRLAIDANTHIIKKFSEALKKKINLGRIS